MSDLGNPPSDRGWQPPSPEELHAQLPQYEILEVLGIGGMGAVYKGFQTSLERYVAIKILPPSFDEDEQYAQRFKQEAKTMARLSHVGIIGVHDCGQTASGLLYIVMEFVEGTDIHRMIQRQGRLSAEEAMAITLHVCDALGYAHDNGVVHRDIKPANIMVDTQGRVKVADFGLAKSALLSSDDSTSNITMGTPDYVAPEALMMGVEVDQRVDVFGVGVMLYEMLTGKTPTAQFEPASGQVPGLDPRYDQIIGRATRHDRDARYGNAQELKNDLIKIHTVPMSQSGLRRASQEASAPSGSPEHAAPAAPVGGFPVTLVGAGLAAVLAIGLFLWKPWGGRQKGEEAAPLVVKSVSPPPEATHSATPAEPPAPAAPHETPVVRNAPSPAPELPAQEKPAPAPAGPPVAAAPKKETAPAPKVAPITPAPVATVPAKPVPAPPPSPPSELDVRLRKLDQQFHAAASRDVEPGFKASVATLDKGYTGALERALTAASQAGKLEEALAIRAEKQRLEKGQSVPPEAEDGDIPASLKVLRKTYRSARAKLDGDCTKALQPLYDKYDQALAYYESERTKAGKLDEATRVKTLRTRLSQIRLAPPIVSLNGVGNQPSFTNSLGMKFVFVPGTSILMCIHETRRKDYAAYAAANPGVDETWKNPNGSKGAPVGEGDDEPVVTVNWDEAKAFCAWLSKKEGRDYRLPTDREWSVAVGLGDLEPPDEMPAKLDAKIADQYPWGTQWPPPPGAGNYADHTFKDHFPTANLRDLENYTDGYVTTAPVMSFSPNMLGIYDLGGNVWQWCEDWYSGKHDCRVARGASWVDSNQRSLLASRRAAHKPEDRSIYEGFRCVLLASPDLLSAPAAGSAPSSSAAP